MCAHHPFPNIFCRSGSSRADNFPTTFNSRALSINLWRKAVCFVDLSSGSHRGDFKFMACRRLCSGTYQPISEHRLSPSLRLRCFKSCPISSAPARVLRSAWRETCFTQPRNSKSRSNDGNWKGHEDISLDSFAGGTQRELMVSQNP